MTQRDISPKLICIYQVTHEKIFRANNHWKRDETPGLWCCCWLYKMI